MSAHRSVYTHAQLTRLFNPTRVAIYGASPNPQSFGARTIANMAKYQGKIIRINPRYEKIGDEPCYPSVADAPETPDCAVFCIPRDGIEAALLDCANSGVGGAVIFASGYTETGVAEHAADQARLTAIARDTGIKIIGPNTLGMSISPPPRWCRLPRARCRSTHRAGRAWALSVNRARSGLRWGRPSGAG